MGGDEDLAEIRREVAERRFRDVVQRARRLSGTSPEETLAEGIAMIDAVHSLEVRPL